MELQFSAITKRQNQNWRIVYDRVIEWPVWVLSNATWVALISKKILVDLLRSTSHSTHPLEQIVVRSEWLIMLWD